MVGMVQVIVSSIILQSQGKGNEAKQPETSHQLPFFLQVLYHNCHFHCDCNINDIHHDINDKLSKWTCGCVSKKSMNLWQKNITDKWPIDPKGTIVRGLCRSHVDPKFSLILEMPRCEQGRCTYYSYAGVCPWIFIFPGLSTSSVIQDSKRVQDLLKVEDMIYCLDFNAFCLGKIWERPLSRLYPKLMLILSVH